MSKDYTNVEDLLSESDYGEYEGEYEETFSYKSLFKSSLLMLIFNILVSSLSSFIVYPKFGKPISVGTNSFILTIVYIVLSILNLV